MATSTANPKTKGFVLDFEGNLIPREKARKIQGQYYEEGVSCILMPDGTWYRTNTNKILFDHYKKVWIFREDEMATKFLITGLVGENGKTGYFTQSFENVTCVEATGNRMVAMTEEVAIKNNFVEAINDGVFYAKELYIKHRTSYSQPGIPGGMKTNTYNLDDDPKTKAKLISAYKANVLRPGAIAKALDKCIPYSFGLELETSNGHIPPRLATPLGVRPLRDGSVDGIEYTTIPLDGSKGLESLFRICQELTKRTTTDLKCSVHVHFGNVRRDKLYIVSLWYLLCKIQDELFTYFPYSRSNSIDGTRKVYCKKLPHLQLDVNKIIKENTRDKFHTAVVQEFSKIYKFLNNKAPGEIKDAKLVKIVNEATGNWKVKEQVTVFSTKITEHSIQGPKWNREMRYHAVNLLPLFFSPARTIEFRIHEASTNFSKIAMWMLICSAILQAAEDFEFVFRNEHSVSSLLSHVFGQEFSDNIMPYLEHKRGVFMKKSGDAHEFKSNWINIENKWLQEDKTFSQDLSWITRVNVKTKNEQVQ